MANIIEHRVVLAFFNKCDCTPWSEHHGSVKSQALDRAQRIWQELPLEHQRQPFFVGWIMWKHPDKFAILEASRCLEDLADTLVAELKNRKPVSGDHFITRDPQDGLNYNPEKTILFVHCGSKERMRSLGRA